MEKKIHLNFSITSLQKNGLRWSLHISSVTYWTPKKDSKNVLNHTGLFEMIVGVLITCHTQYS